VYTHVHTCVFYYCCCYCRRRHHHHHNHHHHHFSFCLLCISVHLSYFVSQELAELAMGTYKHIGRIRSARMIGRDLAAFYIQLGEMQKAAVFLMDALKTFEEENWKHLAIQTQCELADCYIKMNDKER